MTYASFRDAVLEGFTQGFTTVRPDFPVESILYNRGDQDPPNNSPYIVVYYAELEGEFEALGRLITQTALLTIDVFVPDGQSRALVESIADDIRYTLQWLILPDSGRKTRLSKRDFAESLGGYAQSRVSCRLLYDIRS